jgi:hypothetical protein
VVWQLDEEPHTDNSQDVDGNEGPVEDDHGPPAFPALGVALPGSDVSLGKRRAATTEEEEDWHKRRQIDTQSMIADASNVDLTPIRRRRISSSLMASAAPTGPTAPSVMASQDTPTEGYDIDQELFSGFDCWPQETESPLSSPIDFPRTQEPLIDPSRLLPILEQLWLSDSAEHFQYVFAKSRNLALSLPVGGLRLIEDAADFFSPMPHHENAFPVFLLSGLARKHSSLGNLDRIMSCVHAAKSPSDVELVQSLLMDEISDLETGPSTGLVHFLLQILLILLYKLQNNGEAFKEHRQRATGIFYGLDSFISHLQTHKRSLEDGMRLNLTSYYLVHLAFGVLGVGDSRQSVTVVLDWGHCMQDNLEQTLESQLKLLEYEFLSQRPGPFELQDGALGNSCLRDCLRWCHACLQETIQLPVSWRTLRQQTVHREWAEKIGIYWFLWNQHHKKTSTPDGPNFWTADMERVMGMSVAQLIFNMVSLMLQASPNEQRHSRLDRVLCRKDVDLIHRATAGGKVLLESTDEDLSRRFLAHLVEKDFSTHPPSESRSAQLYRIALTTFRSGIQDAWTQSGPAQRAQLAESSLQDQFPGRLLSLNNTLASSHSSSTLSSMRRLAAGMSRRSTINGLSFKRILTRSMRTVEELCDSFSALKLPIVTLEQPEHDDTRVMNP